MAVIVGGGGSPVNSVQKAATGPNPSPPTNGQVPPAQNQGVTQAGAATQGTPVISQPPALTYDYSSDPILQLVMGQQQLAISQAQAQALAQQKAALIAYGDPNLALSVLGDQTTADAAKNNASSTLAQLAATNAQNVRGVNTTENAANLWYSSDRGYQLGLAQQSYLNNQSAAAGSLQSNLGSIGTNLLAAEQAAYNAEAQAQQDAYNRALANPIGVPNQTTGHRQRGGGRNRNLGERQRRQHRRIGRAEPTGVRPRETVRAQHHHRAGANPHSVA